MYQLCCFPFSGSGNDVFKIRLKLPAGLTCSHGVILWWWRTRKKGAVPTKIAAWAAIRSRRHLSTVLTSQSLKKTAAFHQRAFLARRRARGAPAYRCVWPQSVNVEPSVTGKGMQAWMTGESDHVAAVTALATCAPASRLWECDVVDQRCVAGAKRCV